MSKRNAAPTIWWVVSSNFTRIIAVIFFVQWLIIFIALYGIKYHLDRSCYNTYERDLSMFGYDISVGAGKDVEACVDES